MSLPAELQARVHAVKARVDLVALIGRAVRLRRVGREWTGLCPFHQEKTGSFSVVPDKGFAHCFGCGWHGDALRFVQDQRGLSFADALRDLEAEAGLGGAVAVGGGAPVRRASFRDDRDEQDFVTSLEAALAVWRDGRAARGTIVESYLRHRGVDPAASGLIDVVRFLPRCPTAVWRRGSMPSLTAPAMLAPVCRVEGPRGERALVQQGVHVTFLAPDGRGKAKLPSWTDRAGKEHGRPSRKIWGEAARGCVPVPPVGWAEWRDAAWLDRGGSLVIGEGIESTLSLMVFEALLRPVRGALATLSLGNLQGHWVEDGPKLDGAPSLPLWNVRSDAQRPPVTIPDAGAVTVGVDADMAGLRDRRVQERPKAPPIRRDLTGAERTTICAQLASHAWRRAGASPVRVARPHAGRDFNDVAMETAV